MLTVIRDVATTARRSPAAEAADLVTMMELLVEEARRSVERTPELLDVLRDAGVVDAGGQGIYVILQGILHYLRGEVEDIDIMKAEAPTVQPAFKAAKTMAKDEEAYGYCTELLIKGENLDQASVREWLDDKGKSILVVGDSQTTKIHVHTLHPGQVIEHALSLGSLHDLKIENMDDQHQEFVQMRRAPTPPAEIAVVAVAAGDGLESFDADPDLLLLSGQNGDRVSVGYTEAVCGERVDPVGIQGTQKNEQQGERDRSPQPPSAVVSNESEIHGLLRQLLKLRYSF